MSSKVTAKMILVNNDIVDMPLDVPEYDPEDQVEVKLALDNARDTVLECVHRGKFLQIDEKNVVNSRYVIRFELFLIY